ncbi:hypothetical protein K402DRAFT_247859 [Aulographum hederae CBS 113979]|uniref:Uncharacterized protein n=1 Tax=Aulographum hederae CBS 113979 TaxID=1176131 RepID=A0A6G1HA54_9PEZI|nr:hypothetical protein K402DRAFT_247859 [Aulographum hederae CBS 113979]
MLNGPVRSTVIYIRMIHPPILQVSTTSAFSISNTYITSRNPRTHHKHLFYTHLGRFCTFNMPGLLDLPVELLVQIFIDTEKLRWARNLASTNRSFLREIWLTHAERIVEEINAQDVVLYQEAKVVAEARRLEKEVARSMTSTKRTAPPPTEEDLWYPRPELKRPSFKDVPASYLKVLDACHYLAIVETEADWFVDVYYPRLLDFEWELCVINGKPSAHPLSSPIKVQRRLRWAWYMLRRMCHEILIKRTVLGFMDEYRTLPEEHARLLVQVLRSVYVNLQRAATERAYGLMPIDPDLNVIQTPQWDRILVALVKNVHAIDPERSESLCCRGPLFNAWREECEV